MADDARFVFWSRFLSVVLYATVGSGVLLALFDLRLAPPLAEAINESVWGTSEMPAEVVTYHRFVHGVLGATMVAWALALAEIVRGPFRRREAWAWRAVATSIAAWFALDTLASIHFGVWPNVWLNVAVVVPLALPLVVTRGEFGR